MRRGQLELQTLGWWRWPGLHLLPSSRARLRAHEVSEALLIGYGVAGFHHLSVLVLASANLRPAAPPKPMLIAPPHRWIPAKTTSFSPRLIFSPPSACSQFPFSSTACRRPDFCLWPSTTHSDYLLKSHSSHQRSALFLSTTNPFLLHWFASQFRRRGLGVRSNASSVPSIPRYTLQQGLTSPPTGLSLATVVRACNLYFGPHVAV